MKKIRKSFLSIIIITLFLLLFTGITQSYAAIANPPKRFGVISVRPNAGYGYLVSGNDKVWKIVEYNDASSNPAVINYSRTIYCLKQGLGFGSGGIRPLPEYYDTYFDMKKEYGTMPSNYKSMLPQSYNEVLWLLDNIYVADGTESSKHEREALLAKVFKDDLEDTELYPPFTMEDIVLTDDDMDVVQQLAVWYFTNPENDYLKNDVNLFISSNEMAQPNEYKILSDREFDDENGYIRLEQANKYFNYLKEQAKLNASNYGSGDIREDNRRPIELSKNGITVKEENGKYIIGPYKIEKVTGADYTLNAKFKKGTESGEDFTNYTLLDKEQKPTSKTINELVGENFYISVPTTEELETLVFTIDVEYYVRELQYWTVGDAPSTNQPIVIVKRIKKNYSDSVSVTIKQPEKNFDISLRKFITTVNDKELKDGQSRYLREPIVDISKLNTIVDGRLITTAEYNHPKTPVSVKAGDTVVYTIRVYNEGEVNGYANEITDYLPPELEFLPDDPLNKQYGWIIDTNDSSNRTVKTNYLSKETETSSKEHILNAFTKDSGKLDYKDVQIKCKVKYTNIIKQKITNIAEITEYKDESGNIATDRDSTQNNVITPSDSDLPNYKDNEINSGKPYIPGQEDDDDFEKLVMQRFDISLRKFITSVNNEELLKEDGSYIREPIVDVTPLKEGTGTTAIYKHTKIPVEVKVGDIVVYTIRVYNEGEVSGYANEIIDHLPPELEFLPNDELNKEYGWELDASDPSNRTIKTKYLSYETNQKDNLIDAYNKDTMQTLDYKEVKVKCVVKTTQETGKKITNIAEITEYKDESGNIATDVDSDAGNVVLPTDENLPKYKDDEINSGKEYIPGQEDDDDFEKIVIRPKEGIYQVEIEKVDEDGNIINQGEAEFRYDINGQESKTGKTVNGILSIGSVGITEIGTPDKITIEETKAPEGYNKLIGEIEIEVEKGESNGSYVATGVKITKGGTEGTKVSLSGNVVKITVPNKPKEGTYQVEIEKVDENGNIINQGEAEFRYDINSQGSKTGKTVNGILNIGSIGITEIGTPDKITIEETKAPEGYNKLIGEIEIEVEKGESNGSYVATGVKITKGGTEGTKVSLSGNVVKITVPNKAKEGTYQVEIEKVDENGNIINQGEAEFRYDINGQESKTGKTVNGILSIGSVGITEIGTPDKITIEETKAPEGYNKLIGEIEIEVEKGESNGSYVATGVKITKGGTEGTKVSLSGNVVKITVPNKPKEGTYQVEIEKVDENGNIINQGEAEFRYDINGQESKTGKTVNGILNIGSIVITEIGTLDKITIEETKAPEGYNKLIGEIEIEVEKGESNGSYVATGVKITKGGTEGTKVSLSGNVVKITVPNKPKEGIYQVEIEKVDENGNIINQGEAEFRYDINSQGSKTGKTVNGILSIGSIGITEIGTPDKITIEETKAPEGYNKLIGEIEIEVEKGESNGSYVATGVKITKGGTEGTKVSLSGNVVKITVPNKAKEGTYQVEIEKVDENGNIINQGEAEFRYDINGQESKTGKTVNGILSIGSVGITEIGTPDKITIEETKAPEGYNKLIGKIEIEVEKGESNGSYVATGVKITKGGTEGTKVSLSGNVVKITVPNKPKEGTYQVEIEKVDENGNIINQGEAEFRYDINGQESKTGKTVNGILSIGSVGITEIGTPDKITIEETKAPEGYNKLIGEIEIEVEKGESNGSYVATGVKITKGGTEGTKVSLSGNVVKITVPNKPKEGTYQVEIEKVDENGNIINQGEAEFRYDINSQGSKTGKTVNGILNIGSIGITEIGTPDKITIEETNAPEGYNKLIGEIEIEVEKSETSECYVATGVKITKGGTEGTKVELSGNVVKITVPNRKKIFDLALRKFITGVNDKEITDRVPQVNIAEDGTISYLHTKEPVEVVNGNLVTYTLRVYNEGTMNGYAKEIKDDIPEGLEFIPDNETNKEYRWKMLGEDGKTEVKDVKEAKYVVTDYLSKEQEKVDGENLIPAFDKTTMKEPAYKDVKVIFKVVEPNTSDRIVINTAEISDDSDEDGNDVVDKDSVPDNNKPEEDDIDIEKVKVKYFDLALKKWVTQAIVIENGKSTITETGHTGEENPEPIVKVDLHRKDINKVTVKFKYKIKVTNEGEIEGYVKEITDHIPEGLKFVKEDNPKWVQKDEKTITTDQLKDTLLKPGESATVEVVLTWINDGDNMGVKVNIAEISKDYNDSHTPDIDSTPGNEIPGEDDIDDAPVMLTVAAGEVPSYIGLGTIIVAMLAGGIFLIKRYVFE